MKNEYGIEINSKIISKKDVVFKALFGGLVSERKGFLKRLLESVLEIEIDSLTVNLPTEMIPDFYSGRKTIVDVRAKLSDGTNVNIEVQSKASGYSDERCLQHWSKIYANDLKKSQDYKKSNKTICIWVLNENAINELDDYLSKWKIADIEHKVYNRFNELEFYILELKKFRKNVKMPLSEKEMWISFLDYTNKGWIKMACEKNEVIRNAQRELNKIKADPRMEELIEMEELWECDRVTELNDAIRQGTEAGRIERTRGWNERADTRHGAQESKIEIAKKLLKNNVEIEIIMNSTGLTKKEIEKLK